MPETDPVAVIGMGAVGTLPAGALAAAGHPTLACGRARLTSITVTTDTGSASYAVTGVAAIRDYLPVASAGPVARRRGPAGRPGRGWRSLAWRGCGSRMSWCWPRSFAAVWLSSRWAGLRRAGT